MYPIDKNQKREEFSKSNFDYMMRLVYSTTSVNNYVTDYKNQPYEDNIVKCHVVKTIVELKINDESYNMDDENALFMDLKNLKYCSK